MEFADRATEDVYDGLQSAAARKRLPQSLHAKARIKMDAVSFASSLNDLRVPPSNRLEALAGDRAGQYSIRINDKYRLCFVWRDDKADHLEIVDYH